MAYLVVVNGIPLLNWKEILYLQHCNKKYLSETSTIRSLITGFLLLVFALGITPKLTLHNLFASHKDGSTFVKKTGQTAISKYAFNCQCENQVIESPFTVVDDCFVLSKAKFFTSFENDFTEKYLAHHLFGFTLRGPPAIA